jgi:hypothetical protein
MSLGDNYQSKFKNCRVCLPFGKRGWEGKLLVSVWMVWQVLQHVLISEILRHEQQTLFFSRIDATKA